MIIKYFILFIYLFLAIYPNFNESLSIRSKRDLTDASNPERLALLARVDKSLYATVDVRYELRAKQKLVEADVILAKSDIVLQVWINFENANNETELQKWKQMPTSSVDKLDETIKRYTDLLKYRDISESHLTNTSDPERLALSERARKSINTASKVIYELLNKQKYSEANVIMPVRDIVVEVLLDFLNAQNETEAIKLIQILITNLIKLDEAVKQYVDLCSTTQCLNGGICHNLIDAYQCKCRDGFNGTHCELDIGDCRVYPCLNGGECSDNGSTLTCKCPYYTSGFKCEVILNLEGPN